jgi:hypothetical protein
MPQKCDRCGETLIREELEDGNLCFECFEAQLLETETEESDLSAAGAKSRNGQRRSNLGG